jgi:hypothetical protein
MAMGRTILAGALLRDKIVLQERKKSGSLKIKFLQCIPSNFTDFYEHT